MARQLRQAYIYRGQIYQPGDDLPGDVAEALEERGAFSTGEEVVADSAATVPELDMMQLSEEVATGRPDPQPRFQREEQAVVELMTVNGIGEEIARVYVSMGIFSRDDLRRASDELILAAPGVGKATLKDFREQLEQA